MLELVLLRHAKTESDSRSGEDFDRALTDVGRSDAPLVVEALVQHGVSPEIALVSTATRAQQTWQLIAPALPDCAATFDPELYLSAPETIAEAVDLSGRDRVIVVAHNPGLHELACQLTRGGSDMEMAVQRKFPTGAAAVFRRPDRNSRWRLEAFLKPKDLRAAD